MKVSDERAREIRELAMNRWISVTEVIELLDDREELIEVLQNIRREIQEYAMEVTDAAAVLGAIAKRVREALAQKARSVPKGDSAT